MRGNTRIAAAVALGMAALGLALLWPAPDPLAGASTVAVRLPDGKDQTLRAPLLEGLSITLGKRDVRIVADPAGADAVLAVQDVQVESVELRLDSGGLTGRLSALCLVTDLRTGREHTMDLRLELRDGEVRATLTARRFWEFWKRG
ncbi:MAG: hypothetical protein NUV94_00020 [Candidatus Acetothermia bacterium]|jgi:hypothetical protein|nr:hypothetical protein [Candidatus Acetothermia bacterium]